MTHSSFSIHEMQKSDNFAVGYNELSDRIPFLNPTTIAPAGGINSNLEDLLKWLKLLLRSGEGLIEYSTFNEFIKPQVVSDLICNGKFGIENEILMESYGLGWILLTYRGHFVALHGGKINGFSSNTLFFPRENMGFVILCNKGSTPFPFILSAILMDKLLGLPPIDWTEKYKMLAELDADENSYENPQDTIASHSITEYLGTYSNLGYGNIEIYEKQNKLFAIYNHLHLPLDHFNYDVFEVAKNSPAPALKGLKFNFLMNNSGDIKSLSIPIEPELQGILFMKQNDALLTDPAYLNQFTGSYSYMGFTIRVEEADKGLVVKVFGQPPYQLYPDRTNQFRVKDLEGYLVEFLLDESKNIYAVQMTQPNNTSYTAKKI